MHPVPSAVAALMTTLACATPPFDATPRPAPEGARTVNPFLHAEGSRLVDGEGRTVTLRGVNVGGWLSWEGWMWGAGWQSETEVFDRLVAIAGEEEAVAFRRAVYERFIAEEDFAAMASLGFNAVRIPLNHELFEMDGVVSDRAEGFVVLDRLLDACARHRLYCIPDLHAAPGGQSSFYVADPESKLLWDDPAHEDRTVALWEAIARRYANHHGLGGYDLLNEPDPPNAERLIALYDRLVGAIRQHDAHHLIVLEGRSASSDFDVFTEHLDWNQAYGLHQYSWVGDSRADELDHYGALAARHGVPTFAGEFGLSWLAVIRSWGALFEEPQRNLSGWFYWSWKLAPGHTPGLVTIGATGPAWAKVKDAIGSTWAATPTREEAREGLAEFLDAIRFENCALNDDMARALVPDRPTPP